MTEMIRRLAIALTPYINHAIAEPEEVARAVLEEMRNPTGEMIGSFGHAPGTPQEYWTRSIEAALGEGPAR